MNWGPGRKWWLPAFVASDEFIATAEDGQIGLRMLAWWLFIFSGTAWGVGIMANAAAEVVRELPHSLLLTAAIAAGLAGLMFAALLNVRYHPRWLAWITLAAAVVAGAAIATAAAILLAAQVASNAWFWTGGIAFVLSVICAYKSVAES